jgi:glycerol-3-phosphate cytidylyltransferase
MLISMLDKKIALENLKDLDIIFRKNGTPCWLQDGTLLGYYRENNFISHDLDTDMGMMYKDLRIDSLTDAGKIGFEWFFIGYLDECAQIVFKRNGIKTDVFLYYEEKDYIYHSAFASPSPDNNIRIDYHYKKFNLKEVIFLGHNFLVPSNELEFLLTKYGGGWQTPNSNWNYAYSPLNHKVSDMIFTWDECSKRHDKWFNNQKPNEKKIITYGTFDTFHYGHLELLRRAKNYGNHLTVAISTDNFNKIKGKESRFNFEQRREWIKSISYTDEIILEKNWNQKKKDIKKYKIDILIMGDDWTGKFDDLDCLVIYLNRTPEISSTKIKEIV